ncbi:PREDICTED: protein OSB2, chloroplastic-like isoform X2 [Nelumbo nucifera]|uniref:Protein OSB3, chloroplastic/mitochondrial-like n=2 Tax=Nelumbo nucifera TaxID=4432 RepID=A0A822ZKI3_NELNU|nr:PREDICTED: protein OSB2, chloroplastic-like isoform X2 [Nelumbo nucifera]DAD45672.1 TPA_asm: hypothetical protein HUJ06_003902 [Nelumbo nucifera]
MKSIYRAFAGVLSSPSTKKWLLHPIVVQSSVYSTTSMKQKSTRKPKSEPSTSESDHKEFYTVPKRPEKEETNWPRPSEIPWQAKVANSVNLIGSVAMPVHFQASPDGKYWAGTIIKQEKTLDLPFLWIPIIFEGDLAHTAACHLKENDRVYVGGQLSADPPPFAMQHGQANVQVMVQSINFVSRKGKLSYSYKKDEPSIGSETKDDISVKQYWDDLLAKPHEWWDIRLNKNNPTGAAFEHKENGQLLCIDESTPESIHLRLNHLTFDHKITQKWQKSVTDLKTKDVETGESCWRDLVDNPNKWRDYRKYKLDGSINARYPDFKHKDSGLALWLGSAPKWILSKLEGLEFDSKIHKTKQGGDNKEEESWKNLIENPEKWWDNRLVKLNKNAPDFKHKETGKGLWLNSSPAWVHPKLPPVKIPVSKKDTLLS